MEQMKNIIDKMQALQSSQSEMSQIDIDLMLDYTRRLYEELLRKKNSIINNELSVKENVENVVGESSSSNTIIGDIEENSKIKPLAQEEMKQEKEEEIDTVESTNHQELEEENQSVEAESLTADPEIYELSEIGHSDDDEESKEENHETTKIEEEKEEASNIVEEEILSEEGVKEIAEENIFSEPAEEVKEITKTTNRNLVNFEMPPQRQTEWEKQEITVTPTFQNKEQSEKDSHKDKTASPPSVAESMKPLEFDFGQEIHFVPKNSKVFDVRSAIGVNDRYLFLNELFFKKKDAYDKALESINQMNDIDEAKEFVDGLAKEMNWDKEDETVQGFYQVLNKAFSTK